MGKHPRLSPGEQVLQPLAAPLKRPPFVFLVSTISVAKRQFTTDDGVVWIVWDVHPEDLGRLGYDRRTASPSNDDSARAERTSRRSDRLVHPELQQGWLCFQSETEKRRLSPIPAGWHELPDVTLRKMLSDAVPAPHADGRTSRPSVID